MAKQLYTLNDVIGQTNIVKWFKSCVSRDKLPQVIMMQGPAGIGKTSIAKIVACEIACINKPDHLDECKKAVIGESKSTDCVSLYNMSNLKSQEAVTQVKSDLAVGFSSTGRKVVIMDEAHGMSDDAQDSLLVQFESLPVNVYVIVCTTEIESFRDAFLSRCVLRRLTSLNKTEMRTFISNRIKERNLTFELGLNMVYALIANYTGREPRRAINLIDSFEENSRITTDELNSFFNVYEGRETIQLVSYLYDANILKGLEYISDMSIGSTFGSTLLEVLRVMQGGESILLQRDDVLYLRDLAAKVDIMNLIGFCVDCTTKSKLSRNNIAGYFLKWCIKKENYQQVPPAKQFEDSTHTEDLGLMREMIEVKQSMPSSSDAEIKGMSLEDMLAAAEVIDTSN